MGQFTMISRYIFLHKGAHFAFIARPKMVEFGILNLLCRGLSHNRSGGPLGILEKGQLIDTDTHNSLPTYDADTHYSLSTWTAVSLRCFKMLRSDQHFVRPPAILSRALTIFSEKQMS